MTIGFLLRAPDNDLYMLQGDAPHPACPRCGMAVDHEWIDPGFKIKRTSLDASSTYDGYFIVSERFRSVADGKGARFLELPSSPAFYALVADTAVSFDAVRRRTKFEQHCPECGRFFAVAGATPAFLLTAERLADRFFRTDVEFGSGDEQKPLILVGPGLAEELRDANLAGLDFLPVMTATDFFAQHPELKP